MRSHKSACKDAIKALHVLCCALTLYIYLLDLSMLRALIRHGVHVQMLWQDWDLHPGKRLVVLILGSNGLLLLWHLMSTLPLPGAYQNGYLHGGLFIDFVGQGKKSTSCRMSLD
ncbi:hypothetical protein BCR37DRAFT_379531 [Protomyces lactucae-debilis]|uniref:DUF1746 domain-containing protein n=1 Tax=Protomyces lactucae-debilis TaxID=2754530 RepID=A0A1Y2FFZ4_PROLT|nr:uncharacterized protein BCR37DRAFT_379531 [Protomyces lactucae-debilis]ORY82537.1 hypothetical protein BCR37DRAFT_379531 [Protomyces lactucae-debilis]